MKFAVRFSSFSAVWIREVISLGSESCCKDAHRTWQHSDAGHDNTVMLDAIDEKRSGFSIEISPSKKLRPRNRLLKQKIHNNIAKTVYNYYAFAISTINYRPKDYCFLPRWKYFVQQGSQLILIFILVAGASTNNGLFLISHRCHLLSYLRIWRE